MAIKIIKKPDVYLTATQLRRYQEQYRQAFMMYAGIPPDFEEWVARQEQAKQTERGDRR